MNKLEIENKINELENKLFYLKMQDVWDSSDYRYSDELNREIIKLKKELENG